MTSYKNSPTGKNVSVAVNEISERAQRYKKMHQSSGNDSREENKDAASDDQYVTERDMFYIRMRIDNLEQAFDDLLQRVMHLETMDLKFRDAHDHAASLITDMLDSIHALEGRVFPDNTEFSNDVQNIIGTPLGPSRKTEE